MLMAKLQVTPMKTTSTAARQRSEARRARPSPLLAMSAMIPDAVITTELSGRDFFADPLAGLVEPVLQFIVGLLGTRLDAIPGGFGRVLGLVQLLAQLVRLFAQGLQVRFGLGFVRG